MGPKHKARCNTVLYDTLLARLNVLYYYEKYVSVCSADYIYVLSSSCEHLASCDISAAKCMQ